MTAAQDDEAGSKGHIDFTIDQIANLPIGTEITNTADIYFDFNEAVITNTTLNKIEISSGINNLTKDITHKVYPNPSNGSFYLETLEENINNIVVFDLTGKKVFSSSGIHHKKALINLKGLDNGTYILQIHTKNKISSSKIIINKDK